MAYKFVECWTAFSPVQRQEYIARTVFEARQAFAKKLGCPAVEVMGRVIKSSQA